ncbi:MAG: sodium:proton antiporter [Phycisphaerae bacterium]|jgi:Na+/H+ antiporter NhaD/arsenite permease-like protein
MLLTLGVATGTGGVHNVPGLFWVWPFVAILLAIAIFPLMRRTHHWWEENKNKLLVALVLAFITLAYYGLRGYGVAVHHEDKDGEAHAAEVDHGAVASEPPSTASAPASQPGESDESGHDEHATGHEPHHAAAGESAAGEHEAGEEAAAHEQHYSPNGLPTIFAVIDHAVLKEYIPFIVLLFSLYVIAGGIVVRGDIRATPLANTCIIGAGGLLASFIGTTGAAMLLIRFLLKTNSERRLKVHTVVFFIFIAANVGGTLLPIGDPPLFLGYLRGVPFFWTLQLWKYWVIMLALLLAIYYVWDTWAYRHEEKADLRLDETQIQPMHVAGLLNVIWIFGVVAAVATLDPAKPFPGTNWHAPMYLREGVQLLMALASWVTTSMVLRKENQFNFVAIGEVACLFIGIFITMQVPIEILRARGAELGLHAPWHFFWATGILSSFLDNAPTYVVYFETASSLPAEAGVEMMHNLATGSIPIHLLIAISCGAVFMGANTYIGNGPNFMVKAIAEQSGVKMPSFFGYMMYSGLILIPTFVVLTLIFFRS